MKKLYPAFAILFTGFVSQAQINKGAVLLGGGLNFYNSTQKSYVGGVLSTAPPMKSTLVSIQPSAMEAIGKNLLWGINLDFSYQAQPGNDDLHYNEYGVGTFVRKYKPLGGGFYLFGQSGLEFTYGDERTSYPANYAPTYTETKNAIISLGFSPGIAYSINSRWQVEMLLSGLFYADYVHDKETDIFGNSIGPETTNVEKTNGFDFGSNLSTVLTELTIGIHYVIGAK
jgi:hypothetical protein